MSSYFGTPSWQPRMGFMCCLAGKCLTCAGCMRGGCWVWLWVRVRVRVRLRVRVRVRMLQWPTLLLCAHSTLHLRGRAHDGVCQPQGMWRTCTQYVEPVAVRTTTCGCGCCLHLAWCKHTAATGVSCTTKRVADASGPLSLLTGVLYSVKFQFLRIPRVLSGFA